LVILGDGGRHAGADGPGAHAVDGDVALAEFDRKGPREPDDPVLAHRVGAVVGRGLKALGGGHVDDAAALRTLLQPRETGPDEVHLAGEVDLHGTGPDILVAHRHDVGDGVDAGVVHEDVEATEGGRHLLHDLAGGGGVGHVENPALGLAARAGDLLDDG